MMGKVVKEGTGTAAALEGIEVAGKTGTAEVDRPCGPNQLWFIAFAPAQDPRVAIAVTVECADRVRRRPSPPRSPSSRDAGAAEVTERPRQPRRSSTAATGPAPRSARGGMADVYCAEDLQLGRKVALKLLLPPLRRGRGVRRALPPRGVERRRACSTSTSSPSTTAASGTAPTTSRWSTSRGARSRRSSSRRRRWSPTRAIDLTIQILRAARFAHRRGIIHRDLKPHNVIVDDEGRAKVTDFGIARAGASDMTQTGSIMGTAQYLSPEQAQGHAVSAAVGPLLDRDHPLRAAHRPRPVRGRERRDDRAQAGQRAPGAAERATTRRSRRSSRRVVLRALEKDPARRFPDADEFIAALRGAPATGTATAVARRRRRRPPPDAAERGLRLPPSEPLPPRRGRATARALVAVAASACSSPRRRARRRAAAARHAEGRRCPTVVGADQADAEAELRQRRLRASTRR